MLDVVILYLHSHTANLHKLVWDNNEIIICY